MKKLTTAQQKVLDTIEAGTKKFAGKTYEEAYSRKEDRTSYTKYVYEMAQKGFVLVYGQKATFDSLTKRGLIETIGGYSFGSQFVKLAETKAEEPENKEEEDTMKYTVKSATHGIIGTFDNEHDATSAMNTYNWTTENDKAYIEKEDTTMKTTFTLLNGTTYTMNPQTNRYAKTVNGKTTRIGKAEYEKAQHEYDLEQEVENLELHPVDEQAELDKEPCRVEVENDLDKPVVLDEHGCVDCSKCNCDKCVHRNCMRRNPRNVGGNGECPRLDNGILSEAQKVAEETGMELAEAELAVNVQNEQKKPRKARKSKDIAYEGHGVTLTAKQVDFLLDLKMTDQWDGFDTMFWTDVICDEIEGQFAGKPMTVGAMISTLCEKGLAERSKGEFTDPVTGRTRKSTYMAFTGLGEEIAKELGL